MIRAANKWHAPRFIHRCSNHTIPHGPFGSQTSGFSNEPLDLDCGPRGAQRHSCAARGSLALTVRSLAGVRSAMRPLGSSPPSPSDVFIVAVCTVMALSLAGARRFFRCLAACRVCAATRRCGLRSPSRSPTSASPPRTGRPLTESPSASIGGGMSALVAAHQ